MDPPPTMMSVTIATGASVPIFGEALRLRLPRALSGPGSILDATAPTGATRFNYHTAFVKSISQSSTAIVLEVLPAPSYSHPDDQGYSSATWLLRQTPSFRDRHLPLPYTQSLPPLLPHPPTPTHPEFGPPLQLGGWRDRRPSWIDIDTMQVELRRTTRFKRFSPPVVLSPDEMMRIAEYTEYYYRTHPTTGLNGTNNDTSPDGDCDGLPLSDSTAAPTTSPTTESATATRTSSTSQNATDGAGKHQHVLRLWEYDDDDSTDDGDDGDDVDFVGHAQLFRPDDPYLAQLLQARRESAHGRLVDTVMAWAGGVQV